jgi:hypothetical protein
MMIKAALCGISMKLSQEEYSGPEPEAAGSEQCRYAVGEDAHLGGQIVARA